MFKVHPGSPNEVPVGLQLICMQRRRTRSDTGDCGIVYSARGFSWLFPTDLTLAGHHVWKTQASEMTVWSLAFVC